MCFKKAISQNSFSPQIYFLFLKFFSLETYHEQIDFFFTYTTKCYVHFYTVTVNTRVSFTHALGERCCWKWTLNRHKHWQFLIDNNDCKINHSYLYISFVSLWYIDWRCHQAIYKQLFFFCLQKFLDFSGLIYINFK